MSKTDMLRDIIKVQRDLFSLVEKYPELNAKPLQAHTQTAIKGVMALYDNSLVETIKSSLPADVQKIISGRANNSQNFAVSPE